MLKFFERNGTIIALCGHKKKPCDSCNLKKVRQKGKILICTSNPEKYRSFNPPPDPQQKVNMLVDGLAILAFLADVAFNVYRHTKPKRTEEEEEWVA